MFEGSLESAKEHKPPRVMPQLMDYFKAIKVRQAAGLLQLNLYGLVSLFRSDGFTNCPVLSGYVLHFQVPPC